MLEIFVDDDRGFVSWLRANPGGFVVNTARKPTAGYLKLHRATCRTISGTPPRGSTWTKDYVKACAPTVRQLSSWAMTQVGGTLGFCGTCHPPT